MKFANASVKIRPSDEICEGRANGGSLMTNQKEKTNRTDRIFLNKALHRNRRELLQLTGIGLFGVLVTQKIAHAKKYKIKFNVLDKRDQIDVGDKAEQMIENAYKLGYDFEKKHGGCARCTVAALQKSIEFAPEDKGLFRAASCLDGGATPQGIQNCGAFTGSGMVIGWVCGNETFGDTRLSHNLIRKVYERFEKEYGSVLCRDVKKKAKRNCPEVVGTAAKWAAEVLLKQFTNYE